MSKDPQKVLQALGDDVSKIQKFILQQLLNVVEANKGEVKVEDPELQSALHSLITADPDAAQNRHSAVISFEATKKKVNKTLDELRATQVPEEHLTAITKQLEQTEKRLFKFTKDSQTLKSSLEDMAISDLTRQSFNCYESIDAQGMPSFLSHALKVQYADILAPKLQFSPAVKKQLLQDANTDTKGYGKIIEYNINHFFADEQRGKFIFNPDKLSANLANFAANTSAAIEQKYTIDSVMESAIAAVEKQQEVTLSDKQKRAITEKLGPTIQSLGNDYISEYKDLIADQVATSLQTKKSLWSKVVSLFKPHFSLQANAFSAVSKKILQRHGEPAAQMNEKAVENMLGQRQMTNEMIIDRLNEFRHMTSNQQQPDPYHKGNIPTTKEISKLRATNSQLFDQVFGASTVSKASQQMPAEVEAIKANIQQHATKASNRPVRGAPAKEADQSRTR